MALAAWLAATGRSDCFIVLAEAAIWPGRHDASSLDQLMREDARNRIEGRDLGRYPPAFEQDLETMPPKVVLGRIVRFLRNDLREVLTHADWQSLPWHIDNRCRGCGYLGYSWSTADDEEIGVRQASQRVQERRERWCWQWPSATDIPPASLASLKAPAASCGKVALSMSQALRDCHLAIACSKRIKRCDQSAPCSWRGANR